MLKNILSISGKKGLFKLVKQAKNMIIVEDLKTKKKSPVFSHDKVASLADITLYSITGSEPLRAILQKIKEKENAQKCKIPNKSDKKVLGEYLESVFPDYDKEKVYPSDIKKLISWYDLLVEVDYLDFEQKKEKEA